ncbi:copper amine oxidase-like protein [Lophiostoma macrostomum CBS 122681]|uniref:Amine oxidase n=1 Tax=Lophiostoma macrostomum CBS 122681 TaxID=1314788 RepID=A0A6A6TUG6_9PLEO|nr:copper amine oxidase-like protein [Lophiostoma macrostomum CBS 122681]
MGLSRGSQSQSVTERAVSVDMAVHPFADLSVSEIDQARRLIQSLHPNVLLSFKAITLEEPNKQHMLDYLEAEHGGAAKPNPPPRMAYCPYYLRGTTDLRTAWVNLTKGTVAKTEKLDPEFHGNVDFAEVVEVEQVVMQDPAVHAEIAKLELPDHLEVIPEPWGFGSDGVDDARRLYQIYMFVREKGKPDYNHYAHPLSFSPVFDPVLGRIIRIEQIPTGAGHETKDVEPFKMTPSNEYVPEEVTPRGDLKPLHVAQPEGPSFSISQDRVLRWQKWQMRLSFNYREGLVLRDVRYDGKPLFYRVSLSEMTVPYGDPRSPYHRKMAFDLGDVGAGMVANNLSLGCDCLGHIAYLDGLLCDREGTPVRKENAVCIHEQDGGIGWKHSNYRTERACVTRKRELVLQSILTVSNYEYILAFVFNQAAEFEYEVRATGILSTAAIDEGITVDYGTVVHPGVLAAHHQHILSLRIDPALGSYRQGNRLTYTEAHAMAMDSENPFGNGYRAISTPVKLAGGLDLDTSKSRTFAIQNVGMKNPINSLPASYKIQVPPVQPLLAHPDSFHYRRAEFADHSIYVTKYADDELFCGGKFTNQSRGGTGIKNWVSRGDNVLDEDIVVWVQFGLNHIPRIEDFPVMPCETVKVHLKPVNFFTRNPALDVPPSSQHANRSVLVSQDAANGCCGGKL